MPGVTKDEFREQLRQAHVDALRELHATHHINPVRHAKLKALCIQLKIWREEVDRETDW